MQFRTFSAIMFPALTKDGFIVILLFHYLSSPPFWPNLFPLHHLAERTWWCHGSRLPFQIEFQKSISDQIVFHRLCIDVCRIITERFQRCIDLHDSNTVIIYYCFPSERFEVRIEAMVLCAEFSASCAVMSREIDVIRVATKGNGKLLLDAHAQARAHKLTHTHTHTHAGLT